MKYIVLGILVGLLVVLILYNIYSMREDHCLYENKQYKEEYKDKYIQPDKYVYKLKCDNNDKKDMKYDSIIDIQQIDTYKDIQKDTHKNTSPDEYKDTQPLDIQTMYNNSKERYFDLVINRCNEFKVPVKYILDVDTNLNTFIGFWQDSNKRFTLVNIDDKRYYVKYGDMYLSLKDNKPDIVDTPTHECEWMLFSYNYILKQDLYDENELYFVDNNIEDNVYILYNKSCKRYLSVNKHNDVVGVINPDSYNLLCLEF